MKAPSYCFGVRPGGVFYVRDAHATFRVINEGTDLLRVSVEVLKPQPAPPERTAGHCNER